MPLLAPASSDNQVLVSVGSKSDTAAIDKSTKSVKDLGDTADTSGQKTELFSKAATAAKVAVIALGTAVGVAGFAAVKSAGEFEQNRVAFEVMLGSAGKAQDLMKEMSDFAKTTPFTLPEVTAGAKQLLAYGIQQKDLLSTMTKLGDLASGLGVPFQQLALAYGQVAVKGHLMGQETLQFTNAGVPLIQTLAKTLGKTTDEIYKMQEAGEISFSDVQKALDSLTGSGSQFGGMMAKQSQTFDGLVSNIQDGFGQMLRSAVGMDSAGNIVANGFFDRIKKAAQQFMPVMQKAADGIGPAMQKIMNYVDKFGEAAGNAFTFLTPAINGLGRAIGVDLFNAGKSFINSDFVKMIGGIFVVGLNAAMYATAGLVSVFSSLIVTIGAAPAPLMGLVAGLVAYKLTVDGVRIATDLWKASQLLLNAVMSANPIYLAIGAVVGLTAAIAATVWQNGQATSSTDILNNARKQLTDSTNAAKEAEDRLKGALFDQEGATLRYERAQRNLNETVKQFGPNSLEAREAAHQLKQAQDDLDKATANTRDRTQELKDKQDIVIKNKDNFKKALSEMGNTASSAAAGFQSLAAQMNDVNNKQNSIASGKPLPLSLSGIGLKKNAQGTSYFPGGLSVVGEKGPEIVEMPAGSKVYDAKKTANIMGGGSDTSSLTVHVASLNIYPQTYEAGRGVFDTLNNDSILAGKNLTVNGG